MYTPFLKSDAKRVPNQAKAKRDGVKTHKITISVNFNTDKFWCYAFDFDFVWTFIYYGRYSNSNILFWIFPSNYYSCYKSKITEMLTAIVEK